MSDTPAENKQIPVAWAFYNKDGSIRFIVDNRARYEAWKSAHDGPIVPLVPQQEHTA